jgi:hypothetical protein
VNRWLVTFTLLNPGLTLICFGLMARVNQCQKNMETACFDTGAVLLIVAAIFFLIASMESLLWLVARITGTTRSGRKLQTGERFKANYEIDRWFLTPIVMHRKIHKDGTSNVDGGRKVNDR